MFGMLEAALWLTLNIYHEARGEDRVGQLAVAHTTLNRAKNKDLSVKETVLQDKQFSWTNNKPTYPTDTQAFIECASTAKTALTGKDFTQGATHYHQKDTKPYWTKNMTFLVRVGNHKFYKERIILSATKKKEKRYVRKNSSCLGKGREHDKTNKRIFG